jgi:hypothetical protein
MQNQIGENSSSATNVNPYTSIDIIKRMDPTIRVFIHALPQTARSLILHFPGSTFCSQHDHCECMNLMYLFVYVIDVHVFSKNK